MITFHQSISSDKRMIDSDFISILAIVLWYMLVYLYKPIMILCSIM